MDVEKTIQFLLDWQAQFAVKMDGLDQRLDKMAERAARTDERFEKTAERHDRQMAALNQTLRRALKMAVEEHRRERVRRPELGDKIGQLAAAQLVTEERLQGLIRALSQGTNGH